ncbi:hypothetical protein [Micromonospora sp. 4G55]|uniref:hypothetical protein n=1 Tax=Micromonospora sp. 4G55 TaxID=2806102 RepID=UPI001A547603|nr:hypothetical protein [Micromonospora sp. 4G55]MBM0258364.1 hypothetical protein [Micromonospora sp. 4G55]
MERRRRRLPAHPAGFLTRPPIAEASRAPTALVDAAGTPGCRNREAYFRELAEIGASGRTLSDDEWVDLWARHDQYRVEPADTR